MPENDTLPALPKTRAQALTPAERQEAWERFLTALGCRDIPCRGGFSDEARMDSQAFLQQGQADPLCAPAPVRALHLCLSQPDDILAVAASPRLRNLATLDLCDNRIGREGALALAASEHLQQLTRLDLSWNHIGDAGVLALAASPHLANLTRLDLAGNDIGPVGALALAASPYLQHLSELDLNLNHIGDAAAQALAESPCLPSLTMLNLRGNSDSPRLLAAIESRIEGRRTAQDRGR